MVGLHNILQAANTERATYVRSLMLASERLSEAEEDLLQTHVSHDFRSAVKELLLWDAAVLSRRLGCLDRTLSILAKADPETYTKPFAKLKNTRKFMQGNGRVSWETTYRFLMDHRPPVTQSDFDRVKDKLSFDDEKGAVENWNKKLWFNPDLLVDTMNELAIGDVRCKISFDNDKIISLALAVPDGSGQNLFDGLIKINVDDASVEEKRYVVLGESKRGSGFIKPILTNLHKIYGNLGIRSVKTSAELEMGSYVWARAGYLPTKSSWNKLSKRLITKLNQLQADLPEADKIGPATFKLVLSHLESQDPKSIWFLSDTTHPVLGKQLGYYLLAGEQWKGYLNLDDPRQMQRCSLFIEPRTSQSPSPRRQAFRNPSLPSRHLSS